MGAACSRLRSEPHFGFNTSAWAGSQRRGHLRSSAGQGAASAPGPLPGPRRGEGGMRGAGQGRKRSHPPRVKMDWKVDKKRKREKKPRETQSSGENSLEGKGWMLPNNNQLTPVRAERTWVTPQPALPWGAAERPRERDGAPGPALDRGAVRAGTGCGKGRSHLGCPDPAIRAFPAPRQAPPEGRSAPGCPRWPRRGSAGTPLGPPPRGAAQG